MTTMRDVARVAGVSAKTVSRVFNEDPHVTEETRERVRWAMQKLNYVPNLLARSFRAGADPAVGLAIPDIADPFFAAMTGSLLIRGRLVVEFLGDRSYLTVRKPVEASSQAYTVKPGEVFVMGDDRGVSSDSRFWDEGRGAGVPMDMLDGRVSRVLLGALPDGELDFSRLWSQPLAPTIRMHGFDMRKVDEHIAACLKLRPAVTSPPPPKPARR